VGTRSRRNTELLLLILAIGAGVFADADLGLAVTGHIPAELPVTAGILAAGALGVHGVLRWRARYADPMILPIATVLNAVGLVVIHRLDLARQPVGTVAVRQLMWTLLGLLAAAAVLVLVRDHRLLARFAYTAMAGGLALLLLPLVPVIGRSVNGAHIWIQIGPFSFQPGELAKILVAVFFAGYLVTARDSLSLIGPKIFGIRFPRGRDMGPLLIIWLVSLVVLVFETDLGMSLLYFGLFVAMLYVATERTSWIFLGLVLFLAGAWTAWRLFAHIQTRVTIWLHPFDPANADRAYQLVQGLYGMASGGLLGTGLGGGSPQIVPFANSDFIVASIGEELGLTGLMAVLVLYLLLIERGLRAATGVRDAYGKLLAAGLAFSIALQVFVVVGGVTRVIPLAGLTTPFLAAGGSSLLSNWIIVALLLRISDAARRPAAGSSPRPTGPVTAPA
jgi:cell division protein FtsW (lipid II flippase)